MKPLDEVQHVTSKRKGFIKSIDDKTERCRVYWQNSVTGKITDEGCSTYDLKLLNKFYGNR